MIEPECVDKELLLKFIIADYSLIWVHEHKLTLWTDCRYLSFVYAILQL